MNERVSIAAPVRSSIEAILASIESEREVTILCAVESGSRSWGMASADSDYDVRFVYAHPVEWYLTVSPDAKRDVIEWGIRETNCGIMDCNGWDLRKALGLFGKSNAGFLEWLRSPVVYLDRAGFLEELGAIYPASTSRVALWHHYHGIRTTQMAKFAQTGVAKPWLYALRALLSMVWLEERNEVPPLVIDALSSGILPEALQQELAFLLKARTCRDEQESADIPKGLADFVVAHSRKDLVGLQLSNGHRVELDSIFRKYLYWAEKFRSAGQ